MRKLLPPEKCGANSNKSTALYMSYEDSAWTKGLSFGSDHEVHDSLLKMKRSKPTSHSLWNLLQVCKHMAYSSTLLSRQSHKYIIVE